MSQAPRVTRSPRSRRGHRWAFPAQAPMCSQDQGGGCPRDAEGAAVRVQLWGVGWGQQEGERRRRGTVGDHTLGQMVEVCLLETWFPQV